MPMKLYFKYVVILLKSQLQYKSSFVMTVFTQFLAPFAAFAGIYFLFDRFGSIAGWKMFEVFFCFAIIGCSFAISTCFARGFDNFPDMVKNAGFDIVLVRPRSIILQILGSNFDLKRIGHLLQATIVLIISIIGVEIRWDIIKVITVINMIVGGSLIFTSVYMLQATAAFWTIEGLEVANVLTHGMKEYASYPLSIFPKWVATIFTFIIPFGTVNYLPLQFLLGRINSNSLLMMIVPLLGAAFIFPCFIIWQFGVRHYKSTGS